MKEHQAMVRAGRGERKKRTVYNAVCYRCGWVGPTRNRENAYKDATAHETAQKQDPTHG